MPYKTKEEQSVGFKKWYEKNKHKASYKQKQARAKRKRELEIREWYQDLKKGYSCIRCGISDFRVLDFHHRDPEEKDVEVSNMARLRYSKKRILAEIEKCDCLCANCHRIVHWEEKHEDK